MAWWLTLTIDRIDRIGFATVIYDELLFDDERSVINHLKAINLTPRTGFERLAPNQINR